MLRYLSIALIALASCNSKPIRQNVEYIDCLSWENWSNDSRVRCGFVIVPEDHSNPEGREIKIAFAIKKGDEGSSGHPTIYLSGGPGGITLRNMDRFKRDDLTQVGDVILVDQRGMGKSSALPDLSEATIDVLAQDLNAEEERKSLGLLMDSAKMQMKNMGIDLSKYNSTQNALDFGVLMDALEYPKYNLWGASYGTKLGIYIMKHFPEKIHASALTAPATLDNQAIENRFPDFIAALGKLFAQCTSNPACIDRHEDIEAETIATLQLLKEEPITVNLAGRQFTINPQDAVFLIRYMLYRPNADELLSDFIIAVKEGNTSEIERTCGSALGVFTGVNTTAFYSFNAYEEFSEQTVENINSHVATSGVLSVAGLGWFQSFVPELAKWHNGRATDKDKRLENIQVPTLVITNTFDPVTPGKNSKLFEDAIPICQVLNLGGFGHGAFTPCTSKIRRNFLLNPGTEIDKSCL